MRFMLSKLSKTFLRLRQEQLFNIYVISSHEVVDITIFVSVIIPVIKTRTSTIDLNCSSETLVRIFFPAYVNTSVFKLKAANVIPRMARLFLTALR